MSGAAEAIAAWADLAERMEREPINIAHAETILAKLDEERDRLQTFVRLELWSAADGKQLSALYDRVESAVRRAMGN